MHLNWQLSSVALSGSDRPVQGKTGRKLALKLRKPQTWEGLPAGVGDSVWTLIAAVLAVHGLLVNLGNLYI